MRNNKSFKLQYDSSNFTILLKLKWFCAVHSQRQQLEGFTNLTTNCLIPRCTNGQTR